jgi:hypothetical protein
MVTPDPKTAKDPSKFNAAAVDGETKIIADVTKIDIAI